MHKEILNKDQIELLPLLREFKREFYLVGGTAIALYIGHRRSIDFDLFKSKSFNAKKIIAKLDMHLLPYKVTRNVSEQLNLIISDVKFTFFEYPFPVKPEIKFEEYIKIPSLLDLAAMKAYALGRRSKWKDYVDLYFILKNHYSVKQIAQRADEIFGQLFSEKLFRAQLCFFNDIDYAEEVEYLIQVVSDSEVKNFLTEQATDI
ncbi:MAG: nucleotidyl transferase AbiEii/AbiGii toxin family protein [Paludibacter sp.]|nr:nucleotidyl transferase AbiEii/AbiGii toxin family protein [Paludibacter sp.]